MSASRRRACIALTAALIALIPALIVALAVRLQLEQAAGAWAAFTCLFAISIVQAIETWRMLQRAFAD